MPNYTYQGDNAVLKNLFGITEHDRLERVEAAFVAARYAELSEGHGPTRQFDAQHLKAIHHHLFQDVYEWAGHTRAERVPLSDGTIATEPNLRKRDGQPFLTGPAIPAALDGIEAKLREAKYLRGLPRAEFVERAADIMADINAAHPFREGNGRTQRAFVSQLAKETGHALDFSVVSKERMIQASVAANELGDASMMCRMFDEISDPARVEMLRASIASLEKLEFDWNNHYIATVTPGHTVELVLAGVANDQFMARTSTQILFGKASDLPEPRPQRGETFVLTTPPPVNESSEGRGR